MKWDAPPRPPSADQSLFDAITAILTAVVLRQAHQIAEQSGTTAREEVNRIAEIASAQQAFPPDASDAERRRRERAINLINAILGRISFDKPDGMN